MIGYFINICYNIFISNEFLISIFQSFSFISNNFGICSTLKLSDYVKCSALIYNAIQCYSILIHTQDLL